jgi:hypothetical protein
MVSNVHVTSEAEKNVLSTYYLSKFGRKGSQDITDASKLVEKLPKLCWVHLNHDL